MLLHVTSCYRVLPSFTEFYRVLPSFTKFYRVLPSEFYNLSYLVLLAGFGVVPSFTGFPVGGPDAASRGPIAAADGAGADADRSADPTGRVSSAPGPRHPIGPRKRCLAPIGSS